MDPNISLGEVLGPPLQALEVALRDVSYAVSLIDDEEDDEDDMFDIFAYADTLEEFLEKGTEALSDSVSPIHSPYTMYSLFLTRLGLPLRHTPIASTTQCS